MFQCFFFFLAFGFSALLFFFCPVFLDICKPKHGPPNEGLCTMEPRLFYNVEASVVYTLLSGPMVYTLFPCFHKDMLYTIALLLLCDFGVG